MCRYIRNNTKITNLFKFSYISNTCFVFNIKLCQNISTRFAELGWIKLLIKQNLRHSTYLSWEYNVTSMETPTTKNICLISWIGITIYWQLKCGTYVITLSYDLMSGSEITPCNKMDKPLVVYRFTGNVMMSITRLRT